jgi:hypothetical protein
MNSTGYIAFFILFLVFGYSIATTAFTIFRLRRTAVGKKKVRLTCGMLTREFVRLLVLHAPFRAHSSTPLPREQLHVEFFVAYATFDLSLDDFSRVFLRPSAAMLAGSLERKGMVLSTEALPLPPGAWGSAVETFDGVTVRGVILYDIARDAHLLRFDVLGAVV